MSRISFAPRAFPGLFAHGRLLLMHHLEDLVPLGPGQVQAAQHAGILSPPNMPRSACMLIAPLSHCGDHVRPWAGLGRKRNGEGDGAGNEKAEGRGFSRSFLQCWSGLLQPALCGQLLIELCGWPLLSAVSAL